MKFKEVRQTCEKCKKQTVIRLVPVSERYNVLDFDCPNCGELLLTGKQLRELTPKEGE